MWDRGQYRPRMTQAEDTTPAVPTGDVIFDAKGPALSAEVYGTTRGIVRLEVLWRDLLTTVPDIETSRLRIIDVGAGHGHISARLSGLGHSITLVEPASDLLAIAGEAVPDAEATFQCTLQELPEEIGAFDLVLCHAVLEWVRDPADVIRRVARLARSGGWISILAYNANRALMNRVVSGDMITSLPSPRPERRSNDRLEGACALAPDDLERWCADADVDVTSMSGIRVFHDLIDPDIVEHTLPRLVDVEFDLRHRSAAIGHHLHVVGHRM